MRKNRFSKHKYTILILDPDADTYCENLSASLRDCQFLPFSNHDKACEYFFHNTVDLVLLDHSRDNPFPEYLKFFRSTNPLIPVIIITSCGSEDLVVKAFRSGAKDYLKKSPSSDELRDRIKLALGINGNAKEAKTAHSIRKAVEFIQEHYAMNVRLPQVARQTGMSLSCFVRSFKQNVGVPFTTYLNIVRTTKAQEVIKENNLSMSATAFACGFRNQFHFSRTFKKFTGLTPSDFKKSIRKHSNP